MAVNHYFEVFSNDGSTTLFTTANTVNGDTIITVTETGLTIGTETYTYSGTKKFVGVSFSENSTSPELAIGESFDGNTAYAYIVEAEPTTSGVTVKYNGSVVATIPNGNTATLPIADKKMKTDIVITVPEAEGGGTDSAIPIEVATEAEMTALLESGEVGGVYKYTGTTGTYENGALYVLEEEEESIVGTWAFNNLIYFSPAFNASVEFTSFNDDSANYETFTSISIDASGDFGVLKYGDTSVARESLGFYSDGWKAINITSEPTDSTFIEWLKANATKQ